MAGIAAAAARRVFVPAVIGGPAPALGGAVRELAGQSMGTDWRVRLVAAPAADLAPLRRGIQGCLDEVVAQMSTWEPQSDLCRFNRAPAGSWHVLPEAFSAVLACALDVAEASGGAFDPTAGALVNAWGFGPVAGAGGGASPPDARLLDGLKANAGWRRLELDLAARRLRQPGGVALDFSAIAKGYGVDRVGDWLAARGIDAQLVDVGGELRGRGVKPDGRPWWVALEHPDPAVPPDASLLALHGLSVATSGDYRRWFEHGGVRYSHTVDPRDGRPIRHGLAAVSVLHAECMVTDAWSTALMVMGPDAGLACAAARGLAARFVLRGEGGFEERLSPAFADLLK